MKALGISTLIAALLLFSACGEEEAVKATQKKTVVIDAPGMFCTSCEGLIQDKLTRMEGVFEVKASFDEKSAVCVVAEEVDPAKLAAALPEQYKATVRTK